MATVKVSLETSQIFPEDHIEFSGNSEKVVIHVESYLLIADKIGWGNKINMIKFLRSFSRPTADVFYSLKFCKDIVEYMEKRFGR